MAAVRLSSGRTGLRVQGQIGSDLLRITSDTRSGTLTSDVTLPVAEAFTSTEARQAGRYSMQALEDTLDYMHEHREPFLEGYVMSSAFERFEGGQGLVQFCHQEHRKEEAVIKCALALVPSERHMSHFPPSAPLHLGASPMRAPSSWRVQVLHKRTGVRARARAVRGDRTQAYDACHQGDR